MFHPVASYSLFHHVPQQAELSFPSVLYPTWTAQLKWWMDSDTQTPKSVLSGAQSPAVNVILWQESQIHTNIHHCITSWFQSSNFVFSDNAWENWALKLILQGNLTAMTDSYWMERLSESKWWPPKLCGQHFLMPLVHLSFLPYFPF